MREIVLLMLVVATAGCQRASEADSGKRVPKPPPPAASADALAQIRIDVEVEGKPAPPVDAALLGAKKPDFSDEDRRAWKLTTLLGSETDRDGVVFSAVGEKNVTITLPRPSKPTDPLPVLVVTRRGEPVVALVTPQEPFPPYHGQGGRLHRPGDPLPRVAGVTKIRVAVERDAAPEAKTLAVLEVKIAGKEPQSWTLETLAKVPHLPGEADGGREAWSLRDLAKTLVGPKARVVAVVGDDGKKVIEKSAWEDKTRTPVLRATRDDAKLKFRWLEKDGSLGEAEVRVVKGLEIEP
jgi:hypothetical protein